MPPVQHCGRRRCRARKYVGSENRCLAHRRCSTQSLDAFETVARRAFPGPGRYRGTVADADGQQLLNTFASRQPCQRPQSAGVRLSAAHPNAFDRDNRSQIWCRYRVPIFKTASPFAGALSTMRQRNSDRLLIVQDLPRNWLAASSRDGRFNIGAFQVPRLANRR